MTQIGKDRAIGTTGLLIVATRWVYKRFFVANGNFKANHVQQRDNSDVWLSEGGGMFAKRTDYQAFLRSAIDRLTVCISSHLIVRRYVTRMAFLRKHHVKIDFVR
jgi:hypothetical protein